VTTEIFCDKKNPETTPDDICDVYLDAIVPGLAFVFLKVTNLDKKNEQEEASEIQPTLLYNF
jgi:hypothetical protein